MLLQGPAWVGTDRVGSSTANMGKAAAFLSSECKEKNKILVLYGGMQPVSCPADASLQPWREGQPAAQMGDPGHGDKFGGGDKDI